MEKDRKGKADRLKPGRDVMRCAEAFDTGDTRGIS
jgi:hypothetical protein